MTFTPVDTVTGTPPPAPGVVAINVAVTVTIDPAVSSVKDAIVPIDIAVTVAVNSAISVCWIWVVAWIWVIARIRTWIRIVAGIRVVSWIWIVARIGTWIRVVARIRVTVLNGGTAPVPSTIAGVVAVHELRAFLVPVRSVTATVAVAATLRERKTRQCHH